MRYYEIGSPATPSLVITDEAAMAQVVWHTINKGRRVVVARPDRVGLMEVWRVMDGIVCRFTVNGKERPLMRWAPWVHRVRKLLVRLEADKETA